MGNHTAATRLGVLVGQLRRWVSNAWVLEARFKGVELQGRVEFWGRPLISRAAGGRIVIGDGVVVASAVRANPLGLAQPSVLRALNAGARLVLGPGVGLSGAILCAGAAIEIGEQTILGAGAMVIDNDFHSPNGEWGWVTETAKNAKPVRVGRGVFIGARAILLKGVTVGDRAVVGAGAVVVNDVPPGYIAAGNPARIIAK